MSIHKKLQFLDHSTNSLTSLTLVIPDSYDSENLQKKSNYLIHRVFKVQQANQRQGTANTKTRAEVKGGGRKPWKQKGTGRARAGSTRSPLWRGGGVVFGPKRKKFKQKINRKEWQLSLKLLLINKQSNISVIQFKPDEFFKTNKIYNYFETFISKLNDKILIIVPTLNNNLIRVTKNINNVKILQANCLNIRDILVAKKILISNESLKIIEEVYNCG
jgi:large subunit ribosomal protein L4